MNALSTVYVVKIAATLLVWCVPLILFPGRVLDALGLQDVPIGMLLRMLGWAYLALCVGYAFGLRASLRGDIAPAPVWVGIVSNGGACAHLAWFGAMGAWSSASAVVQAVLWSSVLATALITAGLAWFGARPLIRPTPGA